MLSLVVSNGIERIFWRYSISKLQMEIFVVLSFKNPVVMEVWSGPVEFKQFIAGATVEYESMAQFERYDKERAKCLSVVWNRD